MTTVIVGGGRDLTDIDLVRRALSSIHGRHASIQLLVLGVEQSGAYRHALDWAQDQEVEAKAYEREPGRAGGVLRNLTMLDTHSFARVLCLPGGRVVRHLCETAMRLGRQVDVVRRVGPSLHWEKPHPPSAIIDKIHTRSQWRP